MGYYRHNETLETIARKVISKYDPQLIQKPAAIPVEEIMEQTYGLSLEYYQLRRNGRILGETIFETTDLPVYDPTVEGGYYFISVEAGTVLLESSLLDDKNNGRLRFTCAHELAHWIIDRKYFMELGEPAYMSEKPNRSSEVSEQIERQADRMAARILMPKCTLKKAFHEVRQYTRNPVTELANLYQVSNQAMEIRLKELGLIWL